MYFNFLNLEKEFEFDIWKTSLKEKLVQPSLLQTWLIPHSVTVLLDFSWTLKVEENWKIDKTNIAHFFWGGGLVIFRYFPVRRFYNLFLFKLMSKLLVPLLLFCIINQNIFYVWFPWTVGNLFLMRFWEFLLFWYI